MCIIEKKKNLQVPRFRLLRQGVWSGPSTELWCPPCLIGPQRARIKLTGSEAKAPGRQEKLFLEKVQLESNELL